MKRTVAFLISILISLLLVIPSLYYIHQYLEKDIGSKYADKMGEIASPIKYQGMAMQKQAADSDETLLIFGSSEVGEWQSTDPVHPINFFDREKDGFQVSIVGRGYSQSLIHAINLGALGNDLKGKKVVFVISPQWFDKTGLTEGHFNMNFSEQQFYGFMLNDKIDISLKKQLAGRVFQLAKDNSDMDSEIRLSNLFLKDSIYNKLKLAVSIPYYKAVYFLLTIKDEIKTEELIKNSSVTFKQDYEPNKFNFNWLKEYEKADKDAEKFTNNPFGFDNYLYSQISKRKIETYKGSYSNLSYLDSPEYEDFNILLSICKRQGINPLIVSMPMPGKWYDYCGYDKERRKLYYDKISSIVNSYNFKLFDMSKYEYDNHMFKDYWHIGWKGWVYIDEAIDKYYNESSK